MTMLETYAERYSTKFSREDGRFTGKLGELAVRTLDIKIARETHFIRHPEDGRQLSIELTGLPGGHNVILEHGMPGSRTSPKLKPSKLWDMGINLITYDRPGYGYSDPKPGRRPIDTVSDVAAILDYLGIRKDFSVIGRSGGGQHALACAARLDGVKNVAVLACQGPRELMGEAWYKGMGQLNSDDMASMGEGVRTIIDRVERMQKDPNVLFEILEQEFAPDDVRVMNQLKYDLLNSYEEAVEFGPEGWVDDFVGSYDWGFDPRVPNPRNPNVPVLVWYGGHDPFVPPSHGRWLVQNVPNAREEYVPEASHFRASLEVVPEALNWCSTGYYQPFDTLSMYI